MNYRSIAAVVAGLCVCTGAAIAQQTKSEKAPEKKMEMPKPGPEVKKLGYFVGSWKTETEAKPNTIMPAGKTTEISKCEWFPGGFHVVCHTTGNGPMGARQLGILGYDSDAKAYTYYGIGSASGGAASSKGTVDGSTWTYTSNDKMGGKTVQGRYTITEVSPTSQTFKFETSDDGQTWTEVMEGKATKAVSKAAPVEKK
ncbi:MAG: DUF1579 family protein [Thermoanaerobaculia bacterium]